MTGPVIDFRLEQTLLPDGTVRLTPLGELDLSVVDRLRSRLEQLRLGGAAVRLDLSRLAFMDSSGLGAVLDAHTRAVREGWDFALEPDLAPAVGRLFELTQVGQFIWGPAPEPGRSAPA